MPGRFFALICLVKLKPEFIDAVSQLPDLDSEALITTITSTNAPVSIRHNPRKSVSIKLNDAIEWASNAEYLAERPVFTVDPLFHSGTYYVQEASSMFLEQALKQNLDFDQPLTILDLCAAPGGKSTLIASLLKDNDVLISNEINKTRADILTENIQKWGAPNVMVTRNEPADFTELNDLFDCIVVDAPCSGEGMFRKAPNSIDEWSLDNVKLCAARQQQILDAVWPSLKPGGILIYSTCTYNLEENENQVDWMIDEFQADNIPLDLDQFKDIAPSLVNGIHAARFFPHKTKGEGFFIAVMRKSDGQKGRIRNPKPLIKELEKKELPLVNTLLSPEQWTYFNHRSQIFAALPTMTDVLNRVSSYLYPLHIGVPIGELKGKDLIPAPGLAFSTALDLFSYTRLEVNKEQALALLSRETPQLDTKENGWVLTTYQGRGLVWLKVMQNRVNNYYPKEWRIRDLSRLGD